MRKNAYTMQKVYSCLDVQLTDPIGRAMNPHPGRIWLEPVSKSVPLKEPSCPDQIRASGHRPRESGELYKELDSRLRVNDDKTPDDHTRLLTALSTICKRLYRRNGLEIRFLPSTNVFA